MAKTQSNKISAQRVRQIVNEEINLYRRKFLLEENEGRSLSVEEIGNVVGALGKLQAGLIDFQEKTKEAPKLASHFVELIKSLDEKIQMVLKYPGDYISPNLEPPDDGSGSSSKGNENNKSNPQIGNVVRKKVNVRPTVRG